ncbi:hypothetical protein CYLTODRAFT_456240 [Cylindrobasidium torrendii FP15055 ss-10]|uniref:Mitochondrial import inner membrane translocase subunit n=1 Tax=Cylindrobasidium torrendii FP15055 ss-10 TaxID=1314674 RepID=A0A0D7B7J2_9AGAR|nr:hypothetical protein CYLTODRAFT_456240 [Cylindrobasidium torrendii FP15055 ss-10]
MDQFDPATQRELDAFLRREQAAAKVQSTIHTLSGLCWDKCIKSTPSNKFSSSEASCLTNCVDRWMDTSKFLIQNLQEKQKQQQSQSLTN